MKTYIKERPIPFSADMVRALLQGWKTQTSRTRGLERFNGCRTGKSPWVKMPGNYVISQKKNRESGAPFSRIRAGNARLGWIL